MTDVHAKKASRLLLVEVQQRLDTLPQSARQTAAWHLASGAILLMGQQFDQAEAEFKRAIAIDPKSSDAYLALGNLYAARNDASHAGAAFKTASELSGVRSVARMRYAQFKLTSGNVEEARNFVLETTQKAPDFMPALTFLAQIAFAEHKRDECAALLKKIDARDSLNYDALMLGGDVTAGQSRRGGAGEHLARRRAFFDPDGELRGQADEVRELEAARVPELARDDETGMDPRPHVEP